MITVLDNMPANVAAFRATGDVHKTDYDNIIIPAVEELLKKQDKINFMLVLDTSLKNFSIAAYLKDIGVGLKHFTKWHKIAIISESGGINTFTNIFGHMVPGKAKGFTHAELEKAKTWVSTD